MRSTPTASDAASDGVSEGVSEGGSETVTVPPMGEVPALDVEVVTDEIEHGWDIGFLPDGGALVTERGGRLTHLSSTMPGAEVTRVDADLGGVFASGEGGLLGMVVHPDFATTREFTTCLNFQEGGGHREGGPMRVTGAAHTPILRGARP